MPTSQFVRRHLYDHSHPASNPHSFVCKMLNLPKKFATPPTIYGADALLRPIPHDENHPNKKYYDRWNAVRSELISYCVPPPPTTTPDVWIPTYHRQNHRNPGHWLLRYVCHFSQAEIDIFDSIQTTRGKLVQCVPLLRDCVRVLRYELRKLPHVFGYYHSARASLIADVIDEHYHEGLRDR